MVPLNANVRALRTAPRKRSASPSIWRRHIPARRYRTFVSPESPLFSRIPIQKAPPIKARLSCIGAAEKNRTFDPVITNDVLYH